VPPKCSPAHYLWAALIARIYEVLPLLCPKCGGQMHLIAFMTEGTQIRRMQGCTLSSIGIWRHNRHRTLRLISASVGEGTK
jgi:hypothetical protein